MLDEEYINVNFVFFDDVYFYELPNDEGGRLIMPRDHFECGMLVNNRSRSGDNDSIFSVLFTILENKKSCKLLKVTRNDNNKQLYYESSEILEHA